MRDLIRSSHRNGFVLSNKSIDQAFRAYLKEGVQTDINQYIEAGALITPMDNILGACFVKNSIEVAPFDAGFDIEAAVSERVFRGIREGSNAYDAGLRNGQEWINGGMERDPTKMAVFVVEESGARKTVRYYPAGNDKTNVPRFELKIGASPQRIRNCQNWFDASR